MQLANRLTKELIIDLKIQEGHGLCYFLNASPCYYNYLAIWRLLLAWQAVYPPNADTDVAVAAGVAAEAVVE